MTLPTWHAARWVRGDSALEITDGTRPRYEDRGSDTDLPIDVFVVHEGLGEDWLLADGMVTQTAEIMATAAGHAAMFRHQMSKFQEMRDNRGRELAHHRALMRKGGLVPPPLIPELAGLDDGYPDPLGDDED